MVVIDMLQETDGKPRCEKDETETGYCGRLLASCAAEH
jgi:hypothetical protein